MTWKKDRIIALLLEAGDIARGWRTRLRREFKPDRSVVTDADREIEALFVKELERPERGVYFIGEETLSTKDDAYLHAAMQGEAYVVDPIDGTVPYAYGLPNWGISIGRMEKGVLTDGAVYLADFGELVLNEGDAVLEGIARDGHRGEGARGETEFEWRELPGPERAAESFAPLSITQSVAKRGQVLSPHPVMVLGSAVVPLVGLMQRRFAAYLGSVKLWDIAGCLPLLLRKGYSVTVHVGGERREVTALVEERTYELAPESRKRWALRSNLLICHPEDELYFRSAFVKGDKFAEQE